MSSGVPTGEAAKEVGITRATLQRWIREGRIKAPRPALQNGRGIRLWSKADIERLKKVKAETYWQGRGKRKA